MAASGLVMKPVSLDSVYSEILFGHKCLEPVEDIQIYLATLGSNNLMIPLRILSSDTIASIKLRIQAYKGFYAHQQRLVYGGRELTIEDSLIKDYGVADGEILHLVLRLSCIIDVTIKTSSGREYLLKVKRTKSVKDLKRLISKEEDGLAIEDQQLTLRGEPLDNQRILDELSLEDKSVVHLLISKSAKVRTKYVGKTVEILATATSTTKGTLSPNEVKFLSSACNKSEKRRYAYDFKPLGLPEVECKHENHEGRLSTFPTQLFECSHILEPARKLFNFQTPDVLCHILDQIEVGLNRGYNPMLAPGGSGGSYFMRDEDGLTSVAIFKPMDEEPMAANNPRGLCLSSTGEGLKKGIRVGEGAVREVAAYILDHPVQGPRVYSGTNKQGFAGVPATMMVYCYHEAFNYSGSPDVPRKAKMGSLQQFVHSISDCEDMGPANFPVQEVHKITVLDMRFANTDRNGGNILVCKQESDSLKLVPIDHGYCFPETFEDCTFEWLYWPQARIPYQAATLKYIASLDAEKDIALLRGHGWQIPPKCARVFQVATMLLKKGAAAGLSSFNIGSMMCRDYMNRKSTVEKMLEDTEVMVSPGSSKIQFLQSLSMIMDHYIAEART